MLIRSLLAAGAIAVAVVGAASSWSRSAEAASGTGGGASTSTTASGAGSVTPNGASGTVGSAGSATAGDTSASSIGLGAKSTTPSQSSSSLGVGGSASAPEGRTFSRSRVYDGKNVDFGRSANTAVEPGGTVSRSVTRTFEYNDTLHSRTRTLAREPGSPPERSASGSTVRLGQ